MPLDPMEPGIDPLEDGMPFMPLDPIVGGSSGLPFPDDTIAPHDAGIPPGTPETTSLPPTPQPGGHAVNRLVTNETPTGVVDGTNAAFATEFAFVADTETVTVNGLEQDRNSDYTVGVDQQSVTFIAYVPPIGSKIRMDYWTI